MRRIVIVAVLVAGCGDGRPAPVPTPVATPFGGGGPWSAAVSQRVAPLPCPVASSRSGDANRVVALGGGRFARLAGPYTHLADVRADGRELRRVPIGMGGGDVTTWALACGRGGQLAVAWVEDGRLRLDRRPRGGALTAPVTLAEHAIDESDSGQIALAFTPDGELLVVYAVPYAVHALTVSPGGAVGADVVLGKASGISQVAPDGRAIVFYGAVTAHGATFHHPLRVAESTAEGRFGTPRRLAGSGVAGDVAIRPDGGALVVWAEAGWLRAAVHPPGAPFARSELLARRDVADTPTAAFRPDGRPQVGWTTDHTTFTTTRAAP